MKRRFLAFDIETAKLLPENVPDLLSHRPLGITCAAVIDMDSQHEMRWHGRKSGTFAARMSRAEAQGLVHNLARFVEDERSRSDLSQAPALDDLPKMARELGFRKFFPGLGKSQIGEHVAGTRPHRDV